MKKTYVLDTNILLSDPHSIYSFEDNNVIIPLIVLEELDKFKNRQDDVGKNSRFISRELDHLRAEGNLLNGIKLKSGGIIKVVPFQKFHDSDLDKFAGLSDNADNQIILFAKSLSEQEKNIILVSKDVNVRLKADSIHVKCEDYLNLRAVSSVDEFYTGVSKISLLTDDIIQEIYEEGKIDIERFNKLTDYIEKDTLYPNQIVILKNDRNVNPTATSVITKYDAGNKILKKVIDVKEVYGLKPKNKEQKFALDLLLDDHIKLVTLMGPSGTGKTLMGLVAGLEQLRDVGEHGKYDKLIITRPVQSVGREIGFLPGPQPLDANILTPNGWVKMGDLNIGDNVIGRDGKPTKILDIFPKGKKQVYKISTTDGTSTECCEDHLWLTKTAEEKKRGKNGKIRFTKEIALTLKTKKNKVNHFIPRNEPIEFYKKDLPIPPYTLGTLLGDGSIRNEISLCTTDIEIVERVNKELNEINCYLTNNGKSIIYNIRSNLYNNKPARKILITNLVTNEVNQFDSIGKALEKIKINRSTLQSRCDNKVELGGYRYEFIDNENIYQNPVKNYLNLLGLSNKKSYEKFIPEIYKFSSIEDRINILRGLMDTDGTVKKNGESSFTTTSSKLAKDVQELVRSLGGRATIKERNRIGKTTEIDERKIVCKRNSYEFTVSLPKNINPFYISRKSNRFSSKYIHSIGIKEIEPIGEKEVQCILVENPEHLYVTDDFIVTHNTLQEKMEPWIAPIKDNLSFLLNSKNGSPKKKSKNSSNSSGAQSVSFNDPYFDILREQGKIEVEAISFIRGRSLPNAYIIVEESQNLSVHELKTILTRVGHGTKIVLTGDIEQIDDSHLDIFTNGLSHCVQKFKDVEIAGHVTLLKGERSELATISSKILG